MTTEPRPGRWDARQGEGVQGLRPREVQVIQLMAEGLTRTAAGKRLGISAETVKTHLRAATVATGARNVTELVAMSLRAGKIT